MKKDSGETVGHLPQEFAACFSKEEEKLQQQLQVIEDTHQILYKVGWKFLVILSSVEKKKNCQAKKPATLKKMIASTI